MEGSEKIEKALDLAQAELRSLYKRLGIINSNVLEMVDQARYTAALLGPGTPITKTIDAGNVIFPPGMNKYYLNLNEKIVVCSFVDKPEPPPGIVIGEFDDDFMADKYFDEMVKWRYNSKTIPIDPDCFEVAKQVAVQVAMFGADGKYDKLTGPQLLKEFLPIPEDIVSFQWLNDGFLAWFGSPKAPNETKPTLPDIVKTTRDAFVLEGQILDFAQWYSGMERSKVERAYKRYLREKAPGGIRPDLSKL